MIVDKTLSSFCLNLLWWQVSATSRAAKHVTTIFALQRCRQFLPPHLQFHEFSDPFVLYPRYFHYLSQTPTSSDVSSLLRFTFVQNSNPLQHFHHWHFVGELKLPALSSSSVIKCLFSHSYSTIQSTMQINSNNDFLKPIKFCGNRKCQWLTTRGQSHIVSAVTKAYNVERMRGRPHVYHGMRFGCSDRISGLMLTVWRRLDWQQAKWKMPTRLESSARQSCNQYDSVNTAVSVALVKVGVIYPTLRSVVHTSSPTATSGRTVDDRLE